MINWINYKMSKNKNNKNNKLLNALLLNLKYINNNSICSICLCNININNFCLLFCGHIFCTECINKWEIIQTKNKKYYKKCPLCKKVYNKNLKWNIKN